MYNPTVLNAANTHEVPQWMAGAGEVADDQGNRDEEIGDEEGDEESDEEGDEEGDGEGDEESDEDEKDDEKGDNDSNDKDETMDVPAVDPQQAKYDMDDDPTAPPALLITTSMPSNATSPHLASANARSHPAEPVREFIKDLLNVFPGAEYRPRAKARGAGLGKICGWARARRFDAVIVVGEARKKPCSLTIVQLPLGPTALFRLTSVELGRDIAGHARPTDHTPELILNNFTTALGHRVGYLLQHLFPKVPQLEGRQVVTAHNQRDYVFFRRHRYEFRSADKAALQEIGPRFTLKLVSMTTGLPKGAGPWDGRFVEELEDGAVPAGAPADGDSGEHSTNDGVIFKWKPRMSVSRRNFYL